MAIIESENWRIGHSMFGHFELRRHGNGEEGDQEVNPKGILFRHHELDEIIKLLQDFKARE